MDSRRFEPIRPGRRSPVGKVMLAILALVLLFGASSIAGYVIEYQWWKEMGQTETWFDLLGYSLAPVAAATLLAFIALSTAHARGMRFAFASLRENRTYARIATLALLALSYLVAASSFDNWTAVRYIGSRGLAAEPAACRTPAFPLPPSSSLLASP